jgi:hypothetical protein
VACASTTAVEGEIDLSGAARGPVFQPLKDPESTFARFEV